jgi:hypothetical protein
MSSRSCQWVWHSGTLSQVTVVTPTDRQMAQARSSLLYFAVFLHLVVTVEADHPAD